MRLSNIGPERRPAQRRRIVPDRLDEHCKRLLAAILELSLLQREQPRRQQPQRQEAGTEESQRHAASSRGSSPLRLDRSMKEHGLGARHATALLSVALY